MIAATTRLALAGLLLASLEGSIARAQSTHTLSLRLDNDAFDFWMQPYNRPDEEYTSGVHLTYDGAPAPWWWWSFQNSGALCISRIQSCRSARIEVGQDIYTPSASVNDPAPGAGSRANAGWLYLSHAARALSTSRADALTVTLGVTGPPSLARITQRVAHDWLPRFNRPTDWSRQIRFEPGAIVSYEQRRRVLAYSTGRLGFDVLPSMSVDAGNVKTDAGASLDARFGWNLPHPWLPDAEPFSFAVTTGASGHAVLRDIFLDGNTVNPQFRVPHKPFVESGQLGVEVRWNAFSLAYRAVSDTRSYAGGPRWHPWASIVGAVRFDQ